MYSPTVIEQNFRRYFLKTKRKLVRHTPSTCKQAVEHFNDLYDFEAGAISKAKRPSGLTLDEKDFIRNEIAVCRLDFRYWSSRYAKVRHWRGGHLVPFNFNVAQRIVLSYWSELEEAGLAIACMSLKARQLGISTITEMAVAHRVQFKPYINSIVGSSDPEKSKLMANMMEICWEEQPWWLVPEMTARRAGQLIEFGKQNSGVSIQHGTQFSGIARGTTTNTVHLSEICDYDRPEELIDASLMGAAHESPELFLVLESTAKGRHNWWHNTWLYSKETWPRTLLKPIFLPWFVGSDLYPTKTEMKRNPIPEAWVPSELTQNHMERARLYVQADPMLKKHLSKDWTMPLEQAWWWECKREEAIRKKELSQFLSEYPADDQEAFQSSRISAFDAEIIIETRNRARAQEPLGVFAITGDVVTQRLMPDARDLEKDLPNIPIKARWHQGIPAINFDLMPLKFRSYQEDPNGRLYIWKFPETDAKYAIGVDTSDGIGQDRSIIQVVRLKDPFKPNELDEQVAEFASPYVNARDMWPLCLAVGSMYSVPVGGKVEQIRQVIECNGNGESIQYELRKLGWWHFHPWQHYDSKKPYRQSQKIGWFTNIRTRGMAVDTILTAVRDGWLQINSPWFVDEMEDFERDEFKQSIKAGYGGHDDRIMALAFVVFSSYVNEITTDGRSFFTARKKPVAEDPALAGGYVTPEQLKEEYMKRMHARLNNSPYPTGKYDPY